MRYHAARDRRTNRTPFDTDGFADPKQHRSSHHRNAAHGVHESRAPHIRWYFLRSAKERLTDFQVNRIEAGTASTLSAEPGKVAGGIRLTDWISS